MKECFTKGDSLTTQYRALATKSTSLRNQVLPDYLEAYVKTHERKSQHTLPHIFELVWLIQHPVLAAFKPLVVQHIACWSSSQTELWMPNTQRMTGALYQSWINAVKEHSVDFEVHKATRQSQVAIAFLLPICDGINRKYETNDDEIAEVSRTCQFPRDFFDYKSHQDEFNQYSRLIKMDRLLTQGMPKNAQVN